VAGFCDLGNELHKIMLILCLAELLSDAQEIAEHVSTLCSQCSNLNKKTLNRLLCFVTLTSMSAHIIRTLDTMCTSTI